MIEDLNKSPRNRDVEVLVFCAEKSPSHVGVVVPALSGFASLRDSFETAHDYKQVIAIEQLMGELIEEFVLPHIAAPDVSNKDIFEMCGAVKHAREVAGIAPPMLH